MTDSITFDMDAALKAIRKGTGLTGKGGALTPLIKQLTEAAMNAELEAHLAKDDRPNRKNDWGFKTVKSPAIRHLDIRQSGSASLGCHRHSGQLTVTPQRMQSADHPVYVAGRMHR